MPALKTDIRKQFATEQNYEKNPHLKESLSGKILDTLQKCNNIKAKKFKRSSTFLINLPFPR